MYTVNMSSLRFVWDPKKNETNRKKHGVSFDEAQTVFFDERTRSNSTIRITLMKKIGFFCLA